MENQLLVTTRRFLHSWPVRRLLRLSRANPADLHKHIVAFATGPTIRLPLSNKESARLELNFHKTRRESQDDEMHEPWPAIFLGHATARFFKSERELRRQM